MAIYKETYIECNIEIKDDVYLTINNKNIDYNYDDTNKKWSSRYLPYSQFNSLLDLSKAITKDSLEFTILNK